MAFDQKPLLITLLALGAFSSSARTQSLTLESHTTIPDGGEIVAFSPDGHTVASNVSGADHGTQLYTLSADGTLATREFVSVASEFGGNVGAVSSVALDPLARGFGVMSVIPTDNGTTPGIVVFFDYRSGTASVLKTLAVGFHPDNIGFSRDGSKVFVANEGEFTTGGDTDAPGSVSVIDLSGVGTVASVAGLDATKVTTVDFSASNLASGVDLGALRFNDSSFTAGNAYRHVEPEYITEGDGRIYVTLQENNAIAELSLEGPNANRFTAIFPLGTIEQTIDASDRDGSGGSTAALVDDLVKGIPMPDTIASFVSGGIRYLVTANEGDFRPDDDDRIRVKDFPGVEAGAIIDRSDAALGRLRVVKDLSDPDGNGLIDEAIMPGTRSFSVWNANTGALVADTGSFEALLLELYPTLHNIDGESGTGTFDDRSDDKGPEPEALATGQINEHRYVFVAMERQGAVLMYNLDNPANPVFVAAINNAVDGLVAPESILFVPASQSPTGEPTLLIGYEIGGKIGVYTVVGEPAAPQPPTATPPTLSTKASIKVGAKAKSIVVRGTASANTAKVLVQGKTAKGTRKWNARVNFPLKKKRLVLKAVAISKEDLRATRTVTVLRKKAKR